MAAVSRPVLIALYLIATSFLFGNTTGTKNYYVPWNTTNPIFQISNTDHIIDVNRGNSLFEYDQVTIICPVYNEWTREEDTEKYIIYNVSKEEYDTCRITDPNPRIIAVCDKPYKLMFFTITFRSFTPQPGGLEFRPGQDYFFISTSARGDMLRRIGGRCSTHNMKVVFKVCCNDTATINHIDTPLLDGPRDGQPAPEVPASVAPTWSVERRRTTTPTPTTRAPTTTRHSYKGVHDLYDLHVPSISVKNNKKTGVFDKTRHPNEQKPKKQGLTSSAPAPAWQRHQPTALWSSLTCFLLLRLAAR